jgi:hypothetical protein
LVYPALNKTKKVVMRKTRLRRFAKQSLLPAFLFLSQVIFASSHREAPLISNDPLADNTDLYAFRSPDDPTTVTIIANYIPFQLPEGGPNYYTFGTDILYEIHIKNKRLHQVMILLTGLLFHRSTRIRQLFSISVLDSKT